MNVAAGTRIRVPVEGHLYDVLCNAGALVQLATGVHTSEQGERRTWPVYGIPDDSGDWLEVEIADLAARAALELAAERAAWEADCAAIAAGSAWVRDDAA